MVVVIVVVVIVTVVVVAVVVKVRLTSSSTGSGSGDNSGNTAPWETDISRDISVGVEETVSGSRCAARYRDGSRSEH